MSRETDYTEMAAADMLAAVRDNAAKWATAFCQQYPESDWDVMVGWFANAIENSWDFRCSRFTRDAEAWMGFQERVFANRCLWAKLAEMPKAPTANPGEGA